MSSTSAPFGLRPAFHPSGLDRAQALAGGITSGNIGDALVNIAAYNGMTTAQILDAATTISQNAAAVAPIIQGKTATNVYKDNTSNLTLKGGSFTDIAMSYGHSFFLPGLYVGGNLKAIVGTVSYVRYDILNNNNSTLSHFRDNIATSLQPGIDLGALWQADKLFTSLPCRPRIGVVGRNLNDPKFDQPAIAITNGESAHYSENGQVRMGVALTPLHFWNIAADIDLTNNLTPLPGYHSRMFGVGTEVNVFNRSWINIPLRAGIMQNIANASSKLAYTAGFGVNLAHLRVDVGGAISSEQTQVNSGNSGSKSQKVPSSAAVALQLALAF